METNKWVVGPCATKAIAKQVLKIGHEKEWKWASGIAMTEENRWNTHKEKTCYRLSAGYYGNLDFYALNGYTIISPEEFIGRDAKADIDWQATCKQLYADVEELQRKWAERLAPQPTLAEQLQAEIQRVGVCDELHAATAAIMTGNETLMQYFL